MSWVDMSDMRAQFAHVDPAQSVAEDIDRSVSRVPERAEDMQECRFSCPVGAEECPVLTGVNREIDVPQQISPTPHHVDSSSVQNRGHGGVVRFGWCHGQSVQ
jgi:hypothetical protein